MFVLEAHVNRMLPLIDAELECVDRNHAKLTSLGCSLVESINLYHMLMRESEGHVVPHQNHFYGVPHQNQFSHQNHQGFPMSQNPMTDQQYQHQYPSQPGQPNLQNLQDLQKF